MPSCLVNQCISKTGRKGQSEQIILHPFPKDITRIKEWLQQTGQIFKDVKALAQSILDGNKQNKYRLCSCHFTLDSYIFNKHGRSLKVDAIPSIFPLVKDGECIIAENLKKNRIKRIRKRVGATGPMNERFPGKDDRLLGESRQNHYGMCPCHFARNQYVANSHGPSLEVDGVPSMIPMAEEEECMMKKKSPYDTAAPTTWSNGRLTAEEEEALQGIQWRKIGFCSLGTQTDHTLSNSVLVFQKKQTVGSGVVDRRLAAPGALGLISKLKVEMESLLQEAPIRFEDVAVYFSAEEWRRLGMMERLLYMDVMLENYYNLFSMGFIYEKPEIISKMEKGLDLCHTEDYEKPEIVFRTEKSPDHCRPAGLQPITVKQEPEPDVSTRYWTVESSGCGKQELLLQEGMCNGDEQPAYGSEDFTRPDYRSEDFTRSAYGSEDFTRPAYRSEDFTRPTYRSEDFTRPVDRSEDFTRPTYRSEDFTRPVDRSEDFTRPADRSEDFTRPAYRSEDFTRPADRSEDFTRPAYCSEDFTRPADRSEDFTRPADRSEDFTRPADRSEDFTRPADRSEDFTRPADRSEDFTRPAYGSEDFTRPALVDQNDYNGNKSLVQPHGGQSPGKTWTGSELAADCKSHLAERQHPCTDCGKCFNRGSNLVRHQRIHAGERTYFCGKCGTLIDNSLLLIHRKTYNGKEPYICTNCGSYVVCTL